MWRNWVATREKADDPSRLLALTPVYDETAHGVYVRHLLAALDTKRGPGIRNIALTGGYGTGKSSVLAEITRIHRRRTITISLSTLGDDYAAATPESSASDRLPASAVKVWRETNRIQKEIVKQLLYREDPARVRNSRFRRMTKFKWLPQGVLSAFFALIVLAVIYQTQAASRFVALFERLPFHQLLAYAVVYLLLTAAILVVRFVFDGRLAFSVKAGPATVALADRTASYFDEFLDEIVYFFETTDYDLVIFEDIDRFDNPYIFETLRELNTVLNQSKQIDGDPIRFIYALRDSVFEQLGVKEPLPAPGPPGDNDTSAGEVGVAVVSRGGGDAAVIEAARANRTKFFDLVVPVVPFITHKTARDLIAPVMKPVADVNPEVFDVAAKHITDMRQIKNIRNEFVVFNEKLRGQENSLAGLTEDSLFALLVYKNIHLSDFENIKTGRSQLDALYGLGRKLVEDNIKDLNDKLDHERQGLPSEGDLAARAVMLGTWLRSYIQRLARHLALIANSAGRWLVRVGGLEAMGQFQGTTLTGLAELDSVQFWSTFLAVAPEDPLALQTPSGQIINLTLVDLEEALGESLSMTAWTTQDRARAAERIQILERDKAFLRRASLAELVQRGEFRQQPGVSNSPTMTELADATVKSTLAVDLVRAGYIDWNFSLYVAQYYGSRVTVAAMNFIVHQLQRDEPGVSIVLSEEDVTDILREHPEVVTGRSVYNVSILNHLLTTARESELASVVPMLTTWGPHERDFITAYVRDGARVPDLIGRLTRTWPRMLAAIEDMDLSDAMKIRLLDLALDSADPGIDHESSDWIRKTVNDNYATLKSLSDNDSEVSAGKLCEVLKHLGVQLPSLDGLATPVRGGVVARHLYRISAANLVRALEQDPLDSLALDTMYTVNRDVYRYAVSNVDQYIRSLEQARGVGVDAPRRYTVDNPTHFASIAESAGLSGGAPALRAVVAGAHPACRIEDVAAVDPEFWPVLADTRRMRTTFANVWRYVDRCGVDADLATLLGGDEPITAIDAASEDHRQELAVRFVNADPGVLDTPARVALAASVHTEPLEPAGIIAEGDRLYALMLEHRLLADDEATWAWLTANADWPSRQQAFAHSQFMLSQAIPAYVPAGDLPVFFDSSVIPAQVKTTLLGHLDQYPTGGTGEGFAAAARYAHQAQEPVGFGALTAMVTAGVDSAMILAVIAPHIQQLADTELTALLSNMGGVYAGVVNPSVGTTLFDYDQDHRVLAARLKKMIRGSTFQKNPNDQTKGTFRRPS